jgi:hypothetical protein
MFTGGVTFSFMVAAAVGGASYTTHLGNCKSLVDKRSSSVCVSLSRESPVKMVLYRLTGSLKYSSSKDDEDPEEAEVSCEDDRHCWGESSSILNSQVLTLSRKTGRSSEALK